MLTTRAILRPIDAGNSAICAECDEPVKFTARHKGFQVICNVYVSDKGKDLSHGVEGGSWQRVEHYHAECYEAAGEPHGPIAGKEVHDRAHRAGAR